MFDGILYYRVLPTAEYLYEDWGPVGKMTYEQSKRLIYYVTTQDEWDYNMQICTISDFCNLLYHGVEFEALMNYLIVLPKDPVYPRKKWIA